jgi:hypothetical protein
MTEVGKYRGYDPDGIAQTEADYFEKCPACGEWFDTRDIGQMAGTYSRRRDRDRGRSGAAAA